MHHHDVLPSFQDTLQSLAISTDTSILHMIVTQAGYTSLAVLYRLHVHPGGGGGGGGGHTHTCDAFDL